MRQTGVPLSLKRAIDGVAAAAGLVALAPLLGVVALLSRVLLGSPVLFRQLRPGRHAVLFEVWKFRTMTQRTDASGRLLPDAERLTRYGRFLRATSIDELPQLFNVIRGDLSLVGPRPLLVQYLERYTPGQARRHDVMPGITGWAQVNGRNALTWERKFELDLWYVDHWSLRLDFEILLLTVRRVLTREGVSNSSSATMPEFTGNEANEK